MKNLLDLTENTDYSKLKIPSEIIKNGGIVVFPTETVYGIGVNCLNENAIKNLYKIKKRPLDKPINLLVSDIKMIETVAKNITPQEYILIKKFMPGPLTIILKKKEIVPNIITANTNTIGIRMPANDIALNLIKYSGVPIATPSANISNQPSATNINDAIEYFGNTIDFYINGGESKIGIASTIVQIINNIPHILREGAITKNEIENALKEKND